MNHIAGNRQQPVDPDRASAMILAERELGAFFRAVTDLYESKLAEFIAEEWLRELEATDDLPASAREWRGLTVKVSARILNRTLGDNQEAPQLLRRTTCVSL